MIFKLLFGKAIWNLLDRMAETNGGSQSSSPIVEINSPPDEVAPSSIPLSYPRLQRRAMGSLFEIYLAGLERDLLISAGEEALDHIQRLEDQLSHYRSDSDVARLNANAGEQWVRLEPQLYGLLKRCLDLSMELDGAFDITAGPLVKAWGFYRGEGRIPSNEELAEVMERVGFYRVLTDDAESLIHFSAPGMEVNLGAVGKGYAIDEAAETLRVWGVKSAVIHGGQSTIYTIGDAPLESSCQAAVSRRQAGFSDQLSVISSQVESIQSQKSEIQNGWPFVIRDPRDHETPLQTVYLKDEALSTSGNYEQYFEHEGVRYSHIIDPVTGRPTQGMISVSVITSSAAESDALSTAFFV